MLKKLTLLTLTSVILGGCSLQNTLSLGNAATDTQSPAPMATSTPVPTTMATPTPSPDPQLQAMPSTSNSNDNKSLENDINNTTIVNEDFSNIK